MQSTLTRRASQLLLGIAIAASPMAVSAASAQNAPPPPGYGAPDQGYDVPDEPPPPPGYDGSAPPPPPPGYDARGYDNRGYDNAPPPPPGGYARGAYQASPPPEADHRYEAYAEDWASRNCVKSQGNAGAGAVIGGLFGALVGSSVAGHHDRGAGALVGGIAGAVGGAAVGSAQDNATSPGCPPGFVVRRGAPEFYYPADYGPYYYYAPSWYRPWIYVGGRWSYRPYPYHDYYYRAYGPGRPGWRPHYGRPYYGPSRGHPGHRH